MNRAEIMNSLKAEFKRRKFTAGLLIAFIDLLVELEVPSASLASFAALEARYPVIELLPGGKRANTLTVERGGETVGLRRFYNIVESTIRDSHRRYDYPSCAPHATQAWKDYRHWLDGLCGLSKTEITGLRRDVLNFVLDTLPEHVPVAATEDEIDPVFVRVLEGFDLDAPKGEKSGAALQGLTFAFIRADNPHLQVVVDRVRTGSKRVGRLGDIAAWSGRRLAIAAEVKHFTVAAEHIDSFSEFIDQSARWRAITIIVADDFTDDAEQALVERGVRPLSVGQMTSISKLWDSDKQKIAVQSFQYFARHVEKNAVLIGRLDEFLAP